MNSSADSFEVDSDSKTSTLVNIDWRYIKEVASGHRKAIFMGQMVAILAALAAVPVPLLMPVLVDEVLLKKPGMAVAMMDQIFPQEWHGPFLYITVIVLLTLLLRAFSALFNVEQTRQFSLISKDIIYKLRCQLIARLELSLIHI